jgi:hypothetical protein
LAAEEPGAEAEGAGAGLEAARLEEEEEEEEEEIWVADLASSFLAAIMGSSWSLGRMWYARRWYESTTESCT